MGNITGLLGNMVVIVWWASRVNAWLADIREEVREKMRPKLHDYGNLLTVHGGQLDELERRVARIEGPYLEGGA